MTIKTGFEIEGMKELILAFEKLEKMPTKAVTTAARKGVLIAWATAKKGGWVDQTGYLRKGIIKKLEKSSKKGKKVYDVLMDSRMNDIFQKKAVHKQVLRMYKGYNRKKKYPRLELKQYYYPSSIEYGFKTRSGSYVPGFHFLKESITDNKSKIEKTIVDVLSQEIDKLK